MSWVLQPGKVAFDASDFDNDAARQEKATSGQELIRLTNWVSGNTSRPLIQAGSKIVVNNTLFYTDSDTALINDPGGLVDGEVFIRFEKSGTDPSFTLLAILTNDDPRSVAEFDAAKGGWYEPATNNKYIDIIMKVSGSLASFDLKGNQNIDNGNKEYLSGLVSLESRNFSIKGPSDADSNIEFASDARILWDESEDEFLLNKSLKVNGGIETDGTKLKIKTVSDSISGTFAFANHGLTASKIRGVSCGIISAGVYVTQVGSSSTIVQCQLSNVYTGIVYFTIVYEA